MKSTKLVYFMVPIFAAVALLFSTMIASADTAAEIDSDVDSATEKLYAGSPAFLKVGRLVFRSQSC